MKSSIAIASDHGGFKLKEYLKKFLTKEGFNVMDFGCSSEQSCDYPDFGKKVAEAVSKGEVKQGILVCGTGIGMSMVANKFKNVRAALVHNEFTAKMAKEHNNANVLCLGGRVLKENEAEKIVKAWLKAEFQGGRHLRRVEKINAFDECDCKE